MAADWLPLAWGFLGIVVTTLGTIAVAWVKARSDRAATTTPVHPSDSVLMKLGALEERTRIHDERLDDTDDSQHVQDIELRNQRQTLDEHHRRLLALERWRDRTDPDGVR